MIPPVMEPTKWLPYTEEEREREMPKTLRLWEVNQVFETTLSDDVVRLVIRFSEVLFFKLIQVSWLLYSLVSRCHLRLVYSLCT